MLMTTVVVHRHIHTHIHIQTRFTNTLARDFLGFCIQTDRLTSLPTERDPLLLRPLLLLQKMLPVAKLNSY